MIAKSTGRVIFDRSENSTSSDHPHSRYASQGRFQETYEHRRFVHVHSMRLLFIIYLMVTLARVAQDELFVTTSVTALVIPWQRNFPSDGALIIKGLQRRHHTINGVAQRPKPAAGRESSASPPCSTTSLMEIETRAY